MATKKKRKSARRRKPTPPAKFPVGEAVRVKSGTTDPEYFDIPLGGWTGTITELSHDRQTHLYLIEWDQQTRDGMPRIFRKRCERDGVYQDRCWLGEADIEPDVGDRLPMEQPTNIRTRPLRMSDEDDRIRAVFGLTSDDPLPDSTYENVCRYYDFLAAELTFPFQAAYWETPGPFARKRCKATVIGLADLESYCHEDAGLLFQIEPRREPTTVICRQTPSRSGLWGILSEILGWSTAPARDDEQGDFVALRDLDLPKKDANRQLLDDLDYWMVNH